MLVSKVALELSDRIRYYVGQKFPRMDDMVKTKVAFRIDPDLLQKLEMVAQGKGLNESDVIREAVSEYLMRFQSDKSCHDVASAIGVIGADETLASDLSTAERHKAGFGQCNRKS
jgi:hypothetical protein